MIVIDASSLAKYILRETGWRDVEAMLALGPYSVDSILKEVSNAIWKHCVRFRRIDRDIAFKLLEILFVLIREKVITLEHQDKYLVRAFEISIEHSIPIYDAVYIAQAEKLKAKLLTSDKLQASIAQKLGVEIVYIP